MTAMTSVRESAPRLAVASLPLLTLFATAVLAQDAAPAAAAAAAAVAPTVDKGDVAWMLVSTLLVTLMAVPGLALFYGGLVRAKNMLSVLMQVMVGFSLIVVLWCIYGYSLAFSEGSAFIGGLSRLFLDGTFDAAGGFWFTDSGKTRLHDMDRGAVFYAMPDGPATRRAISPSSSTAACLTSRIAVTSLCGTSTARRNWSSESPEISGWPGRTDSPTCTWRWVTMPV